MVNKNVFDRNLVATKIKYQDIIREHGNYHGDSRKNSNSGLFVLGYVTPVSKSVNTHYKQRIKSTLLQIRYYDP